MEEQADGLIGIVTNRSQPFGMGMSRVIEAGGILDAEHDGMSGDSLEGALEVRGQ